MPATAHRCMPPPTIGATVECTREQRWGRHLTREVIGTRRRPSLGPRGGSLGGLCATRSPGRSRTSPGPTRRPSTRRTARVVGLHDLEAAMQALVDPALDVLEARRGHPASLGEARVDRARPAREPLDHHVAHVSSRASSTGGGSYAAASSRIASAAAPGPSTSAMAAWSLPGRLPDGLGSRAAAETPRPARRRDVGGRTSALRRRARPGGRSDAARAGAGSRRTACRDASAVCTLPWPPAITASVDARHHQVARKDRLDDRWASSRSARSWTVPATRMRARPWRERPRRRRARGPAPST